MNPPSSYPAFSKKTLYTLLGIAVLGFILWALGPILWPFLLGALLAYALHPGVEWLTRHKVPRTLSVWLMMLFVLFSTLAIVFAEYAVIHKEAPRIQQQLSQLLSHSHQKFSPLLERTGLEINSVKTWITEQFSSNSSAVFSTLWKSLRTSGTLAISLIGAVFMLPLVIYYMLHDWYLLKKRIQTLIPRPWVHKAEKLADEMDALLSQYLRGQLLVLLILALYYAASLSLIGLGMGIPIGIFTGFAILIPYVGYFLGAALAVFAAVLQFGGGWHVWGVVVIYAAGQILEGSFLTPRLVGERLGLHPLAAIFSLLAFGQLFGFFGLLIALPATAMLAIALRECHFHYLNSFFYKKAAKKKA